MNAFSVPAARISLFVPAV